MPVRRKVVDHRLLKVWLPETVDAWTAFRVTRIASVLYVLVHLMTTPLPKGLTGVATTVGVVNARFDHLISSTSSAVYPTQVLIVCKPSDRTSYLNNVFKLWAAYHAARSWCEHDAIWERQVQPIREFGPFLWKWLLSRRRITSKRQEILQQAHLEQ